VIPSALSVPICEQHHAVRLQYPHEARTKRKANNHRDAEREASSQWSIADLRDVRETLGSFALRRVAKFENVFQRHWDILATVQDSHQHPAEAWWTQTEEARTVSTVSVRQSKAVETACAEVCLCTW